MPENENLKLWNSVKETPKNYIKEVRMRGGYSDINNMFSVMRATQLWGPMGAAWGVKALAYGQYPAEGKPELLWMDGLLWYPVGDKRGELSFRVDWAFGLHEETCKKLFTTFTGKALSKLGFHADVYMDGKARGDNFVYADDEDQAPMKNAPWNKNAAPPSPEEPPPTGDDSFNPEDFEPVPDEAPPPSAKNYAVLKPSEAISEPQQRKLFATLLSGNPDAAEAARRKDAFKAFLTEHGVIETVTLSKDYMSVALARAMRISEGK